MSLKMNSQWMDNLDHIILVHREIGYLPAKTKRPSSQNPQLPFQPKCENILFVSKKRNKLIK